MRATPAKPACPPEPQDRLADRFDGSFDVASVREQFPIIAGGSDGRPDDRSDGGPLVYLDNAATTHKPRAVLDSVLDFYTRSNGNVHRGVHRLSERASEAYEKARETVRTFINAADAREVIFTHGATESINMVTRMLGEQRVGPGDRIVATQMEHHSNLVPWQMLCRRTGASLDVLPFDGDGALRIEALEPMLTKGTKLLAITHVSNVLGTVNPVKDIVRIAHGHGVPVLVDAAQSVQHLPLDAQDLDCDFLAFSGHKMYAETGIGVLYGKMERLDQMPPCQYGGGMIDSVDLRESRFAEPPYRFEAGTPNIAGAVSLGAAVRFIESLGRNAIAAHERHLMRYAADALAEIDGLHVYGTTPNRCGAISFNIDGLGAFDVTTLLDQLGVAVRSGTHCAEPVMKRFGVRAAIRASFAAYNTTDDIDALVEGLDKARRMLL